MRIELEKGYNNPYTNQEIIVELKNGKKTGAVFVTRDGIPLEASSNFYPIGVPCNVFSSPVIAWFTE